MINLIKEIFVQNAFTSLKAAVVILLLFLLTKPITKRYTAGFRYYSWLAVMSIFLVPFGALGVSYQVDVSPAVMNFFSGSAEVQPAATAEPEMAIPIDNPAPKAADTTYEATFDISSAAESAPVQSAPPRIDVIAILAVIWLAGAVIYLALHYKRYFFCRRTLRRLGVLTNDEIVLDILEQEKSALGITKKLPVRVTDIVGTPMLTGLLRPEIILPNMEYTPDELHFILRHELFHLKRRDVLYQFITLLFVSLHWFNPTVYMMAHAIEIDGETSCDERVLAGKPHADRLFYGEMLLKFLRTDIQKKSYLTTTFYGGKNGMKKRLTLIASKMLRKKGTAAMAIIMALTIGTSVSAAAASTTYFDEVYQGDASYLADFIKTEPQSISNDQYTLTLEQYLIGESDAVLIYSFQGKTKDAISQLNSEDFWDMDTITFNSNDFEKAIAPNGSNGSLGNGKFDKADKKYFVFEANKIHNPDHIDFYLKSDRIPGKHITVPMATNLKNQTVKCGSQTITLSPISLTVSDPLTKVEESDLTDYSAGCTSCFFTDNYYFRMSDGNIKTLSQLYYPDSQSYDFDQNDNPIAQVTTATAKDVIEPGAIKSIIINDKEYPVDNPSQVKTVQIDEKLKPFTMKPYIKEHAWLPLREFCGKIGADLKWDNKTASAIVKYRGSEYIFKAGKNTFTVDGQEKYYTQFGYKYDGKDLQSAFYDPTGRLIVPITGTTDLMNVDCHVSNLRDTPKENWVMHVLP